MLSGDLVRVQHIEIDHLTSCYDLGVSQVHMHDCVHYYKHVVTVGN